MHKSFSNKSKQDFDITVDKFRKQLESSGTDLARVMLDVGKITEEQKAFVENSRAKISRLEENFENTDQKLSKEIEKSEKEFQEMNGNLSERRREIGALQVCLGQSSVLIATGLSLPVLIASGLSLPFLLALLIGICFSGSWSPGLS